MTNLLRLSACLFLCVSIQSYSNYNASDYYQISAGSNHFCVIDDNGVSCWGDNNYGQIDAPNLINPTKISSGRFHTCAIDDNGVSCWGGEGIADSGQTEPPNLTNVIDLVSSENSTCAITSDDFICWGSIEIPTVQINTQKSILELLDLSEPITISNGVICNLADKIISCWNSQNHLAPVITPNLPPIDFFENNIGWGSCAAFSGGITCWKNNYPSWSITNQFNLTDICR